MGYTKITNMVMNKIEFYNFSDSRFCLQLRIIDRKIRLLASKMIPRWLAPHRPCYTAVLYINDSFQQTI